MPTQPDLFLPEPPAPRKRAPATAAETPEAVEREPDAKRVLRYLTARIRSHATAAEIAADLRLDVRTVERAVAALCRVGYALASGTRDGGAVTYRASIKGAARLREIERVETREQRERRS